MVAARPLSGKGNAVTQTYASAEMPKAPGGRRRFFIAFVLLVICVGVFYLFRPPRFTTKELHEMARLYQNDRTQKELLGIFAEVGRSNARFERNYAIRTFGWIGKSEDLDPEYLEVVYAGLFNRHITTVCASAEALAIMQRNKLPADVQGRLIEIIREHPGSSQSRDAIQVFSALRPKSIQFTDRLLPLLSELTEQDYMTSGPAADLRDKLAEDNESR